MDLHIVTYRYCSMCILVPDSRTIGIFVVIEIIREQIPLRFAKQMVVRF